MTIEEAKSIRIADYLHSLGYSPVKQQGINLWYKSPFREESEASFKVNTEREQWYDFGLGKGGNIIALAAHLYATDHVPYILKRIAEQTPDTLGKAMAKYRLPLWVKRASLHSLFASSVFIPLLCK